MPRENGVGVPLCLREHGALQSSKTGVPSSTCQAVGPKTHLPQLQNNGSWDREWEETWDVRALQRAKGGGHMAASACCSPKGSHQLPGKQPVHPLSVILWTPKSGLFHCYHLQIPNTVSPLKEVENRHHLPAVRLQVSQLFWASASSSIKGQWSPGQYLLFNKYQLHN